MCTVVVLFQVHPTYPLVIAANRDERYARPSSGPTRLAEPPAAVAGRDQRFGGTWFGVNAAGVAVAVTDQGQADADPTRRSRGHLVLDALGCPTVDAVGALLDGLDGARYNPFSLLHADTRQAWIAYHTDPAATAVRRERLAPGLHAVVSSLAASHATWRAERVARLVDPAALAGLAAGPLVDSLATMLRHHGDDPAVVDSICRHNGDHGTVSSFVALLAADLAASQLHCAVGPPCQTAYEAYSGLLTPSAAGVGAKGDDRAVP
jgi:hypothetical protein